MRSAGSESADRTRGDKRAPALLAGLIPGVVGAVAVSMWLHGTLLPPTTASLSPSWLLGNVPSYALWLLLLYPGLLLSPIRGGPLRAEAAAVLVASLALFGAFEHRYTGLGGGALVVGLRFFLPATVVLLPGYAHLLEQLAAALPPRMLRPAAALGGAVLMAGAIGIQVRHGEIQQAQQARLDAISEALTGDPILATNDARELLLAPNVPVVPWFRVPAVAEALIGLQEVQVLASFRADRADGQDDAAALRSFAEEHWILTEVAHVGAVGSAPGVTLWHGSR